MPYLLFYLPLVLAYDALALAHALFQGRLGPLRGRGEAWQRFRRVWAERKVVQKRRRVSWADLGLRPAESPGRVWRRYAYLERFASQNGAPQSALDTRRPSSKEI